MYVRQISRINKNGKRIRYLQIAQKYRDPDTGKPKDEILCHLGREDMIDKGQIRRLISSLSRFLGQTDQMMTQAELADLGHDMVLESSMSMGEAFVLEKIWDRLGIRKTLTDLLHNRSYEMNVERHLFAMVANRALSPLSKLRTEEWVGKDVWIKDLESVSVHNLYRAMDFIVDHHDDIQKQIYGSVATLLNLEVDLLFFDTTSTYFETEAADEAGEGIRKHGHSKDHRPDLPQIVIGLAVTRDGIPVRCWVMEGNKSDAQVVEEIQADMAGWRLNRVVWVVDRGMAGKQQRIAFQRGGGHVIVGEKLRSSSKVNHEALSRRGKYSQVRDNLEIKEVQIENGSEKRRFFVLRNPKEVVRDATKRTERLGRLQEELDHLNDGRRRRGGKHTKAICALKSHPTYSRFIRELKDGRLKIDKGAIRKEEKLDGKFLVSCTDPSLSAEDVALGYKQLWQVERAFRTLKTTLELRPMYHRLEDRIRSHVLLSWLALLMVRVIENMTSKSWEKIRTEMSRLHRAKIFNKTGQFILTGRLTSNQKEILKSLNVKPPAQIQDLSEP